MLGSQLLDRQPFFRGSDFGAPELSTFGMCHFRRAEMTADSWEEHEGTEFLFVLSGEACWEFEDERLAQIKGGQAFAFRPGSSHRIVNGVYTPSRVIWLVFKPIDEAERNPGLMPPSELRALIENANAVHAPIDLDAATARTLAELGQRFADERIFLGSPIFKAEIRSRLYAALIGFWSQAAGRSSKDCANASIVQLEKSLRADPAGRAPIEALAKETGYGHSQLYALFKRELGMSPNDYRQRFRIKQSCRRLIETDRSVTEISFELGFSSSQYFSRVFRKYVGTSPSEYRRLATGVLLAAE